MSVLSDEAIKQLVASNNMIVPFEILSLQGASYDMRLGELIVAAGVPKHISRQHGGHTLAPGDFVVVTTLESLRLPINIIGHNGIMSSWARRGLVSLFSPQIDPGFEGQLEVPIFNAGDDDVILLPGDEIFTIEFVAMAKSASFGWADRHGVKNPPTQPLPPKVVRPNLSSISNLYATQQTVGANISDIKEEIANVSARVNIELSQLGSKVDRLQTNFDALERIVNAGRASKSLWITWISVVVAIFSLVIAFLAYFYPPSDGPRTDPQSSTSRTVDSGPFPSPSFSVPPSTFK